ncbi:hypothetical protein MCJ35_16110 [Enterocloster sp. OA13]|uniref:hypothetical protein n=1 Tax=Enterocloster sp. OA13 TaxID=2914161 RepID=UPI000470499E|nr:hypothetical protein [Enterocloster sp. OA13]
MEWKQFMVNVQGNDILGKMIPLEQGMLYPAFSLINGELCVHFLYHRMRIKENGLEIWKPQYEAVVLYPQGRLVRVQNLMYHPGFCDKDYHTPQLLTSKSQEEKNRYQKAAKLHEEALAYVIKEAGEPAGEGRTQRLRDGIRQYHRALKELLLAEQYETYCKLTGIKD